MRIIERIRKYIQKRTNKEMKMPIREVYPKMPEVKKPRAAEPKEITIEISIEKKSAKKLQRFLYNRGNNQRKMKGIPLKRYRMIQKAGSKRVKK